MANMKDRLTTKQLLGMFALGLGVFIVANDFTAFSVALPAMETSLKTDVTTIQWVINGYSLVVGMFMVTGGRLADTYGRRRIFVTGAIIFAALSVVAGMSSRLDILLVTRAIMGIGGAMMWPATIGMVYALLPPSRQGLGGGLVLGIAGFRNATGPLLGGVLTELGNWHWIFFVNVPVSLV
jgi:MFS family permease